MKEQILFNPDNSCTDICRTIKHSYNGCRVNLIRTSTFGQTGVLEIETMQELINADSNATQGRYEPAMGSADSTACSEEEGKE